MEADIHDALDRLLTGISTPKVVREIEAGGSPVRLWQQLADSGFADALVPESTGGAALSLSEAFLLFFICGRHALPMPLAQTMIARSICAAGAIGIPDGPMTISPLPVVANDQIIKCRNVPFGKVARWVIVPYVDFTGPADWSGPLAARLLPVSAATRSDSGIPGSLLAHLAWENPVSAGDVVAARLPWMEIGGLVTAALMAGAMEYVLGKTVSYAGARSQFGRSIGKFQAVQQQISVLAELVAASRMAAELGCQEASPGLPNPLAAAVAKARASEAAVAVVSIAHAVHAAMGITEEYDLQLYTRRLNEWRTDYGNASYWNHRVGNAVLASDARCALDFMLPAFFPDIASTPTPFRGESS